MAEFQALNEENRQTWDLNAEFWDARMGEGNSFHKLLVEPTQLNLLDLRDDEEVLEVACGNGQFAREMARHGARVLAFDFAPNQIENAKRRTTENADHIEYRVMDATDEAALKALGEDRFAAAVCTMAIMDMASIGPLLAALAAVLKPGGRFVFTVMHPCFNSGEVIKVVEEIQRDGRIEIEHSIKLSHYIHPYVSKGEAMMGQPVSQPYFSRSISELFGACFRAGFVLDGMEEPVFPESAHDDRTENWLNFHDIPPVLGARMRLPK